MEILSLSFWGEVRQALSYAYVTLRARNKKKWMMGRIYKYDLGQ